ncbi:hypothetical protein ACIOG4_38850 [Streptomyces microflavus]|uniref:hypothetical protein n=1 Tax=Streptomyces microflavus TaxID=1919 RepID=UPI003822B0D0
MSRRRTSSDLRARARQLAAREHIPYTAALDAAMRIASRNSRSGGGGGGSHSGRPGGPSRPTQSPSTPPFPTAPKPAPPPPCSNPTTTA